MRPPETNLPPINILLSSDRDFSIHSVQLTERAAGVAASGEINVDDAYKKAGSFRRDAIYRRRPDSKAPASLDVSPAHATCATSAEEP